MRRNQTLDFVRKMENKWFGFDHGEFSIREAFDLLGDYVDSSDPDTGFPNIEHAFQTAEAIRKAKFPDWFQLVGLIHDLGKIMFLWGEADEGQVGTKDGPQWALGGDTWVVGCRIPPEVVLPELNDLNPDMQDEVMSTELGIYEEGCGLDALKFAFGHDEYMYRMLLHNACTIPKIGLDIIRLHSCYPLHDKGCYSRLLEDKDAETIKWIKKFNQYDLYTKSEDRPNVDELWPVYDPLIRKYCGGKLKW